VEGGQGGDETGYDAGFAYTAGVSADDDNGHSRLAASLRTQKRTFPKFNPKGMLSY
jgi:hypothetical protein